MDAFMHLMRSPAPPFRSSLLFSSHSEFYRKFRQGEDTSYLLAPATDSSGSKASHEGGV